jgi:hypothetical protein
MICRCNVLFFGVWLACAPVVLTGQVSSDRYGPLIHALGLTDAQMSQLPQVPPAPVRRPPTGGWVQNYPAGRMALVIARPGELIPGSVLDAMQQFRLADVAKVLQRYQTSAGAVVLGLMDAPEWPWGWTCPLYPIPVYSQEFDLSGDQVTAFEQLEHAARQPIIEQEWAKQKRHRELLDSGAGENSPEVTQLMTEISELMKQSAAVRPPRDAALAVLTGMQRARFSAFEADLELAREAAELRLVVAPWPGEALCH